MRTPFIAGNWKMHMNRAEAGALAQAMKNELAGVPHKLMVAPPFTALETVGAVLQGSNILLGAQNMAPATSGAHTGEISPLMLKDLGVSVVILGHSERRHSYGESDALINQKVHLALQEGLEVILCVGETLEEREANRVDEVVETQMREGLKGITADQLDKVTIAYEPVWAIGTGKTATPDDADAVHKTIRDFVATLYGADEAGKMVIQYGGSVKPDNVKGLMGRDNIDGALVGGASLKTETFVPIAQFDR
ncbi:triosephosphate isomerase [Alkalispirochaeta americana]|uniref:Triosephosphate isomerase n=1 Tax=Alkalispirochaeta americana TaxID=159291 RepID=A0A1N6P3A1_9SPIO|nr:triose-phosphate isomerase [Alkalispirochaeta americana]SIP98878.1 triosephosphate isomerase [Alkalispirochaeta americana]